jgi:polyphosphate kinase
MSKKNLNDPKLFINRELSWLEFNDRVLQQGLRTDLPLLERLKFLAIVSSNLDEFFMIRVAGLVQQRSAGLRRRDPSGLTVNQQLTRISQRTHRLVEQQTAGIGQVLHDLADHGLHVLGRPDWTGEQERRMRTLFSREILPVLTPLAIPDLTPRPLLPGLQLNLGVVLKTEVDGQRVRRIVVVPIPTLFPRFLTVPAEEGTHLAPLEDVVAANVGMLFPESEVLSTCVFRITRDADVAIQDDEAGDLLQTVEEAVIDRRRRSSVRLEISAHADRQLRKWLVDWLELRPGDVYDIDGLLDAAALMEVAGRQGFEELKVNDWPAQPPRDLIGEDDLWQAIEDHDVLLFHPYESFEPVVHLVEQAADDPDVMAIKQTLYRTSGDSPIVKALDRAARNGKQVTVLVELKARFDEARNVNWARELEDAGCHVIYGIAGFKTHAKALLIIRRGPARIQRYVHLATGNYNDKTAKLYSDIGLMTIDKDVASDVSSFFNLLTGYSEEVGWSELTIAPTGMRQRFLDLIDREAAASSPDQPGLIMAKVNSLQDKGICQALYRASQAGVRILLNVRGICCLRPGVEGVSDNIEVTSIVDRFLEHARIYYFRNGGHDEVYLSSADWMGRNLDRRLEILFPVRASAPRRRLVGIMETFFADNVQAYRLDAEGQYHRAQPAGRPVRAQEVFYQQALDATRTAERTAVRFQPLTRPEE